MVKPAVDPETVFEVVDVKETTTQSHGLVWVIELVGKGGQLDGVHLFARQVADRPFITDQDRSARDWADQCTRVQ